MNFIDNNRINVVRMPILLVGYCRPIEFKRIIEQIELLPKRIIKISLDGPKLNDEILTTEVYLIAKNWQEISKHEISISKSNTNLGLLLHFTTALKKFFSQHEFGLVLEDDMEFRCEFIEFLDTDVARDALLKYWSICGHNPLQKRDLSFFQHRGEVVFFETSVHTIWGWAASRASVDLYLEVVERRTGDPKVFFDVIRKFSRSLTKDAIFRISVNRNWFGKVNRAIKSERPNWDNFWLLAGWSSGKSSIMPNYSLCRENPKFFGAQTHEHLTIGESWDSIPRFPVSITISRKKRSMEQSLVAVWGNSRGRAYKDLLRQFRILVGK